MLLRARTAVSAQLKHRARATGAGLLWADFGWPVGTGPVSNLKWKKAWRLRNLFFDDHRIRRRAGITQPFVEHTSLHPLPGSPYEVSMKGANQRATCVRPIRPMRVFARRSKTFPRPKKNASSDPSCPPNLPSRCPPSMVDTINTLFDPSEQSHQTRRAGRSEM